MLHHICTYTATFPNEYYMHEATQVRTCIHYFTPSQTERKQSLISDNIHIRVTK